MIILISLIILFAISLFLIKIDFEVSGTIFSIITGIALVISLITVPTNRMEINAGIEGFKITKITYKNSRKIAESQAFFQAIEMAALQLDVVKINRWLVNIQYYNNTIFDIWVPDEINNLEILK